MTIRDIADIGLDDHDAVGGKGASLGKLTAAGLPVPPGFVVTADTYRSFVKDAGIESALRSIHDIDPEHPGELADVAGRVQQLILNENLPPGVPEELHRAYDGLAGEPSVAVRSSATAEDLPNASFAGQQESYLHVTRDDLVARVKECWASLFTPRAIYYRNEHRFSHHDVNIAVVVQQMVDAEKSGVLFTRHPSTGEQRMVVEAAWGLGEAVVSGSVSPDNYILDRASGTVAAVTVADKKVMCVRDPETGDTAEQTVPQEDRERRVLSAEELSGLLELGERIEDLYGAAQDVEWAIAADEIYLLQSRPITTIAESDARGMAESAATGVADGGVAQAPAQKGPADEGEVLFRALGVSPGSASGPVRVVDTLDELDRVDEGDILVTTMTTPDMVPAMQRAVGIVTDEGGMTSHAAIVSRELGVPAVVGAGEATAVLQDGQPVTIDGEKGVVREGITDTDQVSEAGTDKTVRTGPEPSAAPVTATEVKVNVSIPEAAERAAATGADGVGLLRLEHMILSLGATPETVVAERGEDAYVDEIVEGIRTVAEAFYPRPVRVRTLDAPTDEFRGLDGGGDEPVEHNPMLGYRGIRRSLDSPALFDLELRAFRRLFDLGYDNIELMFPLVNDAADVSRTRDRLDAVGVDLERRTWGVMVETPSSALRIEDIIGVGVDFVSFGTNDLTQYTLAVDRNNERVAGRFDELHPSVLDLIGLTIDACRDHGVRTSICGQAGSHPEMVSFLVSRGVDSISANVDAVGDVRRAVQRAEQRLLLDSVR